MQLCTASKEGRLHGLKGTLAAVQATAVSAGAVVGVQQEVCGLREMLAQSSGALTAVKADLASQQRDLAVMQGRLVRDLQQKQDDIMQQVLPHTKIVQVGGLLTSQFSTRCIEPKQQQPNEANFLSLDRVTTVLTVCGQFLTDVADIVLPCGMLLLRGSE
jgi:hypothetical protein